MRRYFRQVILFLFSFLLAGNVAGIPFVLAQEASGNKRVEENQNSHIEISAKSAVLIEGSTGKIIYEEGKDEERMIASITKIMTLLLIYEEMEQGKLKPSDEITVSEHAAGMGGSQVFLEPGEKQNADTLIKCIVIASANDAAVAMAEHIGGSEEAFVERMNERAKELGMEHTHFANCCGLDHDTAKEQYSSAYDVALVSRELIMNHPEIQKYTTVWMDHFTHVTRKGEKDFMLTNTNKLIRSYDGITGLKTGSTSKAKYCLSATATRGDVSLIAVVLASDEPKGRFEDARKLLDYGFSNVSLYKDPVEKEMFRIPVSKGKEEELLCHASKEFTYVLTKETDPSMIQRKVVLPDEIEAPVAEKEPVGSVKYYLNGKEIGEVPVLSDERVEEAFFSDHFVNFLEELFLKKK